MELYIQTINGQVVNHPAYEDNLLQTFGSIPAEWTPFTRIAQPSNHILPVGVYQVAEVAYVQDGGGWKDSWSVRDMTTEEKTAKIAGWKSYQSFPSWVFDELTCSWKSPVPRPHGLYLVWDEPTLSWIDTTPPEMQLSAVSFA